MVVNNGNTGNSNEVTSHLEVGVSDEIFNDSGMMATNNAEGGSLPVLRFQDQTPMPKINNKRGCAVLSPLEEVSTNEMTEKIRLTIQESIQTAIPHIISNLTMQLKESIKEMVNDAVQSLKVELTSRIQNTATFSENRSALLTLSEAELLESYNRRDNVRILGLPEESKTSPTDKGETYEKSIENVLQLSNKLKAGLDEKDISIAHRLRARNGGPRPIIVRFSRRMAKINLLKKKEGTIKR